MSSASTPIRPTQLGTPSDGVDLDSLYSHQAYITNLNDFLEQTDVSRALVYWLIEYENFTHIKTTRDITNTIHQAIANIDELINEQVNIILHQEKFQQLESSWRGLWFLAVQADGATNIKIRLMDISWAEVVRDISRALEFDQSQLFKKIYSEEYGSPGGEPYGVIIGDYEISHKVSKKHPHDDIATLEGLAQIAAASFAPFISAASSELFGVDDFSTLGMPLNLHTIFGQQEYIKWRALRDKPDARFVALAIPRILMRLPYQTRPGPYKGIYFYEKSHADGLNNYLWGNAAFAMGSILLREFANVGWFGHIRGVPRNHIAGGLITNLPVDCFSTDADETAHKPLTDVIITDTLERELSDLGLMPLCQCYDTPFAAFYNNQSIQKPKPYSDQDANVNAKLSAMLQHVMCGSRIAHYIKIMIRDKIGSFATAADCEEHLREWLFKYTTGREDLDWEEQARYPLREAAVKVKEHPAKPGEYLCVIHLRPHYQLDQMVSELELVTELAAAG